MNKVREREDSSVLGFQQEETGSSTNYSDKLSPLDNIRDIKTNNVSEALSSNSLQKDNPNEETDIAPQTNNQLDEIVTVEKPECVALTDNEAFKSTGNALDTVGNNSKSSNNENLNEPKEVGELLENASTKKTYKPKKVLKTKVKVKSETNINKYTPDKTLKTHTKTSLVSIGQEQTAVGETPDVLLITSPEVPTEGENRKELVETLSHPSKVNEEKTTTTLRKNTGYEDEPEKLIYKVPSNKAQVEQKQIENSRIKTNLVNSANTTETGDSPTRQEALTTKTSARNGANNIDTVSLPKESVNELNSVKEQNNPHVPESRALELDTCEIKSQNLVVNKKSCLKETKKEDNEGLLNKDNKPEKRDRKKKLNSPAAKNKSQNDFKSQVLTKKNACNPSVSTQILGDTNIILKETQVIDKENRTSENNESSVDICLTPVNETKQNVQCQSSLKAEENSASPNNTTDENPFETKSAINKTDLESTAKARDELANRTEIDSLKDVPEEAVINEAKSQPKEKEDSKQLNKSRGSEVKTSDNNRLAKVVQNKGSVSVNENNSVNVVEENGTFKSEISQVKGVDGALTCPVSVEITECETIVSNKDTFVDKNNNASIALTSDEEGYESEKEVSVEEEDMETGIKKKKKVIVKRKNGKVKVTPLEAKPPTVKRSEELATAGEIKRQNSKKRLSLADDQLGLISERKTSITDEVLQEEAAHLDNMILESMKGASRRKSSLGFPSLLPEITEEEDGKKRPSKILEEAVDEVVEAVTEPPPAIQQSSGDHRREQWHKAAAAASKTRTSKSLGAFFRGKVKKDSSSEEEEESDEGSPLSPHVSFLCLFLSSSTSTL